MRSSESVSVMFHPAYKTDWTRFGKSGAVFLPAESGRGGALSRSCSASDVRKLVRRNVVREREPVKDARRFVAHRQHHAVQAAALLADAVRAFLVGEAAGAGEEAERAAGQADDLAIADLGRRTRQPIAALAAAAARDQALTDHLRKHHGQ